MRAVEKSLLVYLVEVEVAKRERSDFEQLEQLGKED